MGIDTLAVDLEKEHVQVRGIVFIALNQTWKDALVRGKNYYLTLWK
ncbi:MULTISPECIES: hypothetical protein [Pelosinus]|nr:MULTISPECIES: hypothetical protein [Pelosinus]